MGLLSLPSVKSKFYGLDSLSKGSISQWNSLQTSFPKTNLAKVAVFQ